MSAPRFRFQSKTVERVCRVCSKKFQAVNPRASTCLEPECQAKAKFEAYVRRRDKKREALAGGQ